MQAAIELPPWLLKAQYMNTQEKDSSWIGILFIIGMIIMFVFAAAGSSGADYEQQQENQSKAVSSFLNDIDSAYEQLVDEADNLMGDIVSECDWLHANIGEEVADYCFDSISNLDGYADLDVSEIYYDDSQETNDILDHIEDQANKEYNSLLVRAMNAESYFVDQCEYISTYISYEVGDSCLGSINGLDISDSPFSASYYYIDE